MSDKQMKAPPISNNSIKINGVLDNSSGNVTLMYKVSSKEYVTDNIESGQHSIYRLEKESFTIDNSGFWNTTADIYISSKNDGSDKILLYSLTFEDNSLFNVKIPSQFKGKTPLYFIINDDISPEIEVAIPYNIQITCSTPEASIYYTTDNTDPDETKNLYTDIFEVKTGTTVKTIATKEGYINSEITSLNI